MESFTGDNEIGKADSFEDSVTPEKFETDVNGVSADGFVQQGTNKFPVFNVDHPSFFQNMTDGRRRLRWPSGSSVQQYTQGTRYKIPFYIRYTGEDGKVYTRKIK